MRAIIAAMLGIRSVRGRSRCSRGRFCRLLRCDLIGNAGATARLVFAVGLVELGLLLESRALHRNLVAFAVGRLLEFSIVPSPFKVVI